MSEKTSEGDELVEEPENNGTASDLETDDVDSVESLDSEEEQTEEKKHRFLLHTVTCYDNYNL